jgi:integrase
VQPVFGARDADSIKPQELTMLYDSLLSKGLKPTSVRLVHALIRSAYSWGMKRGFVSSNPAKLAECPTARPEPPHAPSMETVQAHLEILQEQDPELALVVRVASTIALRRNEIAGLRWAHINLDAGLVSITEGVIVTPGQGASVTSTKTGQHGHGVLSADEGLVSMLRDAFERLEKVAADVGADVSPDAYVFSSDLIHGKPINPDTLTKRLRRHMDRHPELASFTLKDLRAFTATMLEATGAGITTAQAVLRHASGQTTMRHYRAARMDRVRGATVALGQQIAGSQSDATGSA